MRNVELLRTTAEWVERDDGHHYYQGVWGEPIDHDIQVGELIPPCGTTGCVAGNALLASGLFQLRKFGVGDYQFVELATGDRVDASDTAEDILGLDENDAFQLFSSGWSPYHKFTVAQALNYLADGKSMDFVTFGEGYED